jgi:hypothetical protein
MSDRTKSLLILALAVGLVVYWSWVIEDELTKLSFSSNGHKEATVVKLEVKEPDTERVEKE